MPGTKTTLIFFIDLTVINIAQPMSQSNQPVTIYECVFSVTITPFPCDSTLSPQAVLKTWGGDSNLGEFQVGGLKCELSTYPC